MKRWHLNWDQETKEVFGDEGVSSQRESQEKDSGEACQV